MYNSKFKYFTSNSTLYAQSIHISTDSSGNTSYVSFDNVSLYWNEDGTNTTAKYKYAADINPSVELTKLSPVKIESTRLEISNWNLRKLSFCVKRWFCI